MIYLITKLSDRIYICNICKSNYTPNSPIQKYCKKECYKIAMKQKDYIFVHSKDTRDIKNKRWMNWYYSTKKYKPNQTENCCICNKKYIRKNVKFLTCSPECQKRRNADIAMISYRKNKVKILNRRKKDIIFNIKNKLRTRINDALKYNRVKKSLNTRDYIGCSIEFLKEYLEKQFTEGMSWDNYGLYGWHVDHIIPCASFDLTKIEEQRKCFHYTNLQPLWAKENLRKSKKIKW